MVGFFAKLKRKLAGSDIETVDVDESDTEEYVEISTEAISESKSKIVVRPFVIQEFEHIKPILDALREGHTIALINIKPLKDKDIVELKRAINKLKKTCDAIEGDIAGFGEDWIAATPSFAHIYRSKGEEKKPEIEEIPDYEKSS